MATLLTEILRFKTDYATIDGVGYYMAILSRKDNPLLPDRLATFESVFKQISAK